MVSDASSDGDKGNEAARPPRNGLDSNSVTRKPALASAAAAAIPARPPPATITRGMPAPALLQDLAGVEQLARPAMSAVPPTEAAGRTAGVASKTARSTVSVAACPYFGLA